MGVSLFMYLVKRKKRPSKRPGILDKVGKTGHQLQYSILHRADTHLDTNKTLKKSSVGLMASQRRDRRAMHILNGPTILR